MIDKVLATISIISLVAFMGVVVVFVNEPDLWVIVVIVLIMGVFDFYKSLKSDSNGKQG